MKEAEEGQPAGRAAPDEATVISSGNGAATPAAEPEPERASEARTIIGPGDAGVAASKAAQATVALRGPAGEAQLTPMPHTPPAHTPVHEVSGAESGAGASNEVTGVSQVAHQPRPGTRINHYEIIRQLGAGGMGTVFLARDTRLGRRVAIKFLQTTHPELTQRFILEARTTARCQHENIVVIYEVDEYAGQPFMVLEYLQGQTLTKLIEGGQKLPPARAVELMAPVLKALAVAHEQGIVHRDLKPDNIVLTDSGTIKVLDFGIAKVLQSDDRSREGAGSGGAIKLPNPADLGNDDNTNLTRHGAIMGTMSYMSPEQWGIGVEIDHRSDIWAMGIMLFRMIAGKHPLAPLRGQQLIVTAMLNKPMPRIREVAPDVPAGLANVIDKCLFKHKEQRWDSARDLLKAIEPFVNGQHHRTLEIQLDESPYAGLTAFQEEDAGRFFGRTREIAAMVTRIRDQPLMAVVGTSGVGKSSFVRAGLVPALKQSGEHWEIKVVRPGRDPLAALARVISPMVGTSTSVADDVSAHHQLVERLRREPGYLGTVLRSRARREGHKILLFVDQFEELYTLIPDMEERRAFTACLSGVADDATAPLRVVLSVRSDFLDRVPEDERFMHELNQGLYFLTSPSRDGLRDALVQPAEMAGFRFENEQMIEHMLEHLQATHGALPLLQFAASKLWEGRDKAQQILTQKSYDEMGGIAGALAVHADAVVAELSGAQQALARDIFMRLVTPERTRAIVSATELRELARDPKEVQRLIDHLVGARLLVVQSGDAAAGASVEIVHESLVHSWPTLRRWLDDNQDDAVFLEQLRNAAKQWQAKSHDPGLLWRGESVDEASRFAKRYRGDLPAVQREFLKAVFELDARAARRKRFAVIAVVTVLVGMVAAAAVALVVIRQSQQEAQAQAIVAMEAEKQAKDNLAKFQQAEKQVVMTDAELQKAYEELKNAHSSLEGKNGALESALRDAQIARQTAEQRREEAEESKQRYQVEKERAESTARELEQTNKSLAATQAELQKKYQEEKERAERLAKKVGTFIETLDRKPETNDDTLR